MLNCDVITWLIDQPTLKLCVEGTNVCFRIYFCRIYISQFEDLFSLKLVVYCLALTDKIANHYYNRNYK